MFEFEYVSRVGSMTWWVVLGRRNSIFESPEGREGIEHFRFKELKEG